MKISQVFELVIEDLKGRDKIGWVEYGRELTSETYKNPLEQAYEEALDLCIYLKCALLKEEKRT